MKSFLYAATGLALTLAMPAMADTGTTASQQGNMHGNTGSQASNSDHNPTMMRQKVKQDLEQAGFKNVQVMPESFLVRAQNKEGQPVMMIINPDSVTAVTALTPSGGSSGAAQGGSSSSGSQGGTGSHASK
jgi:hypothetical protein